MLLDLVFFIPSSLKALSFYQKKKYTEKTMVILHLETVKLSSVSVVFHIF